MAWLYAACLFGLLPWFPAIVYVRSRCCASIESSKMNVLQVVHLNLIRFDWWERYKTCSLWCESDCLLSIQNPGQVDRLFAIRNMMFYINENSGSSLGQVKKIRKSQTLFWTENMLNQWISNLILEWKHAQSTYLNELNPPSYLINYRLLLFCEVTRVPYIL